ncbi:hypothetical protein DB345_13735 [Spartobacteria bacterium LR76]|nr:hypothetical protein DB345_13735 [Spartobacteria bacterium LR76]
MKPTHFFPLALSSVVIAGWAFAQVPGFVTELNPANIAPTAATSGEAPVQVHGEPRMAQGHPNTLWDQQDIDELKAQIPTNQALQEDLDRLKTRLDKILGQTMAPLAQGGPAPSREDYRMHGENARIISNMGIGYVMTGNEQYGEYGKKLLLEYARAFKNMPHPEGWTERRYRSAVDGRLTGQFLEDGFWLARVAFGADLIYNLKSWTPEEREQVKAFFEDFCSQFYHPVIAERTYINETHNRAAVCTAATLMAGYATDNETLVNIALYGSGGSKEKPVGGVLGMHFSPTCIRPDGLWLEGAPAYQTGIASCGLINGAETLWHHGIDLYRYNNGILKRLLDSAIVLAYPTPKLDIPALHDSAPFALISDANWQSNEVGVPYMCGYRRYKDPAYIPIIKSAHNQLEMTVHAGPPSLFLAGVDSTREVKRPAESANYYSVGYGVLRIPTAENWNQVIMEYGESGSHGHPSKLGLDIFAMNEVLAPFPGVIFPYNDPMDPKWYWTTLANCALTVDEKSQVNFGDIYKYPKGTPIPNAIQTVFAPALTIGMQRAWSDTLYQEKIPQDRAVFITKNYLADLFAVTSDKERKYDLAWHFRGKLDVRLPMSPFTFPEPVNNGYNALQDTMRADATGEAWSAAIATPDGKPAMLFAAGGAPTEVITGDGQFRFNGKLELPPTLIERRTGAKDTLFGNVIDFSGGETSFVKGIKQSGGIAEGFGVLEIETAAGHDVCFVSYRPAGLVQAAGLETDAVQAYSRREAGAITALYLAGGKSLRIGDARIERSETGLAYIEQLAGGEFVVGNPSPTEAVVTVSFPALAGLTAYEMNADGSRGAAAEVQASGERIGIKLKAGARVQFAKS